MSGDEKFILAVCVLLAAGSWLAWVGELLVTARRHSSKAERLPAGLAPLVAGFLLFFVLRRHASFDVQGSPLYLTFYMVMGAAWVGIAIRLLALGGLSLRDDVLERRNLAAGWALFGAVVGLTLAFAGANVGDGPGWWVVLFSAGLSTATFFLLWIVTDRLTGWADAVTIDRNTAVGVRLGGFFVGLGAILGRAVAGDWISAGATVSDFVRAAWPALVLAGLAAVAERHRRPQPEALAQSPVWQGLLPALLYTGIGIAAVWWVETWS